MYQHILKLFAKSKILIITNLFEIFFENIIMDAVTIYNKKKRKK